MTTLAVFTTTGTREEARRLADALVERRLAACAQIGRIESVYTWRGEVQRDAEFRVLFKTTAERYPAVEAAILELHSYELPAIHAFDMARVYGPYADWVAEHADGSS